ncbi:class I SAM-dependent methyltransferase family protein [Streptomyces sp. NPDC050844]|uniref:class I SAM-dependent methyltransferase family protein n=1 Tax=Streptomyces sp. NPDC050844 TaxID=3155790 RepID=UPI00340422B2
MVSGGTLAFTTQTHHPQLDFIANVLPNRNGDLWVMKCHPAEEPESWAKTAGFTTTSTRSEKLGLFTVTTCTTA